MSARLRAGGRRSVAGVLGLLLLSGGLGLAVPTAALADSAPATPSPATPTTVSADGLPTVQINGVAWSQVVVGNTVYVAGKFTSARPAGSPAGTNETPRANLLAYDIRTGELIPGFAPVLDGQALVVVASPDGSRIYVGGDFTTVNGQPRRRVRPVDTPTGPLVATWHPSISSQVRAIAATADTVYLGGSITAVGSVSRTKLAAVSAVDGSLLPWAPVPGPGSTASNREPGKTAAQEATLNYDVLSLVITGGGNQVVAAGRFDTMNGSKATGVAALDPVTGANRPFAINQKITNQGINSAIYSLSTDGTTVFGTAYDYYGPGNLEGNFQVTADGQIIAMNTCHGDTYSSYATGGVLYLASHEHDCSSINGFPEQNPRVNRFATAMTVAPTQTLGSASGTWSSQPGVSQLAWFPSVTAGTFTGQGQAMWSVSGAGSYVAYAGEFTAVNGVAQQGLVRFAVPSIASNKVGPIPAKGLTPTVTAPVAGLARVSWTATSDPDNEFLTYRVFRDGASTPVYTTTQSSLWWRTPTLSFADVGVAAGTHSYKITVTDPWGNKIGGGAATPVTVPAGTYTPRAYADSVRADGAQSYWPLGESSGATTALDYAGNSDLTVNGGVTPGRAGALTGDSDTAFAFNGSNGLAATKTATAAPAVFTEEAWFQTSSRLGEKIMGFGSAASGLSGSYDRHVYMDTSGRVIFGVYPGSMQTVQSATGFNDGKWHHVAASLSSSGMALYLDGVLVASRAGVTSAQSYNGYFRVGGDNTWTGAKYFTGTVDEVALYSTALPADRVAAHFTLGRTGKATNVKPTASFTSTVRKATVNVDASASADPDGAIASYAWDFGDGTTATGVTAAHTYATAGTFPITLTVTDDEGATSTSTASVV